MLRVAPAWEAVMCKGRHRSGFWSPDGREGRYCSLSMLLLISTTLHVRQLLQVAAKLKMFSWAKSQPWQGLGPAYHVKSLPDT